MTPLAALLIPSLLGCPSPDDAGRATVSETAEPSDTAAPSGAESACSGRTTHLGSVLLEDPAAIRDFGSRFDRVEGSLSFGTMEPGDTLEGLDCLRSVTETLLAADAVFLTGLGSLDSLEQVGEISWSHGFDMWDFSLPGVSGFVSLTLSNLSIQTLSLGPGAEPDVHLHDLPWLDSLAALQGTLSRLWINELSSLTTLADWGVTEIRSQLHLVDTPLVELTGLADVAFEEGLVVTLDRLPVESLDGLQGLSVASQLSLSDLDELTSLDALAGLLQIDDLTLHRLPGLTSLSGLEGLRFADTESHPDLLLWQMEALTDLSALTLPPTMGTVDLQELPLATLPPWELVQVDTLDIQKLRSLVDMTGLGQLEHITETLRIRSNIGLQTLEGLQGVREVGTLRISQNRELYSVEALHGITRVHGDVFITNNPRLTPEAVDALLDAIGADQIGGEVTVMDNGP